MTRPLNIAHRGGAGLRPENTLAAFRHAVALGCDGAELDVQLARDGAVVVFHDYRLKPDICRGPHGDWIARPAPRIADLTLAGLRTYDVGRARPDSDYARAHPDAVPADGERIPTLAEVVAVAKEAKKPFHLFVELKTAFHDRLLSAAPEDVAEAAVAVLRETNYLDRAILCGFDWPALLHAKKLAPEAVCWFTTLPASWLAEGTPPAEHHPPEPIALAVLRHWAKSEAPWAAGFDPHRYGGSVARAIRAAGGAGWFPFHADVTRETLREARAEGLKVGAWTVDDEAGMQRLAELRVDAICTDRPDRLARVLG